MLTGPAMTQCLKNAGYLSLRPNQCEILESLVSQHDVLVQSRAGTGKSAVIGFAVAQNCAPNMVTLVIVPRLNLVAQLMSDLSRTLAHEFIDVVHVDSIGLAEFPIVSGHLVLVGIPAHLSMVSIPKSVRVSFVCFDEADELFGDNLVDVTTLCVNKFITPLTKTLLLSATFPPYIVNRIEDSLVCVDPTRDFPHMIFHCVSNKIDISSNPVLSHIKYWNCLYSEDAIRSILREYINERCIIFGGNKHLADQLTSWGFTTCLIRDAHTVISNTSQVIIDPHSNCSRGLNLNNLTVGISLSVPTSKETFLHQIGRISRKNTVGNFFLLIPETDISELDFLKFQLLIDFVPYIEKHNCHPFEIHTSTEKRWAEVQRLIARHK